MAKFENFIAVESVLEVTANGAQQIRSGHRIVLKDEHGGYHLGRHLAGQLPYHYRPVDGIVKDFESQHSALEAILDLAATLPTSPQFRNSHCGEIIAAHFIEQKLNYRRLYSKLTLTTSENTNVHKMDGLFVNTTAIPYQYLFVEAKSSILPTTSTPTKSHRSGILSQLLASLSSYNAADPRFELARIRDNLGKDFDKEESARIRADLTPPGPDNLKFLGVSVTNLATQNTRDDDFILSERCATEFSYHSLVVSDLADLAKKAYGYWDSVRQLDV